jgi:hypothetical protein
MRNIECSEYNILRLDLMSERKFNSQLATLMNLSIHILK